jgi:peptidoglycan hydrolase-like protein with peptidoglycan-binding domain
VDTSSGTAPATPSASPTGASARPGRKHSASASPSVSPHRSDSASPSTGASTAGPSAAPTLSPSSSPSAPASTAAGPTGTTTATAAASQTLQLGSTGPAVAQLQSDLRALWIDRGLRATGDYDQRTAQDVATFQVWYGVTGDPQGVYGPNTQARMADAMNRQSGQG